MKRRFMAARFQFHGQVKHGQAAADHDQRVGIANAADGVVRPRMGDVALAAKEAVVFDARIGGGDAVDVGGVGLWARLDGRSPRTPPVD